MNEIAQRSRMNRLIFANRLTMAIALSFLLAVGLGLGGCENQKQSAKEPVVTKQIEASAKSVGDEQASSTLIASKTEDSSGMAPDPMVAPQSTRMPYNPVGKVDPFTPLYKDEGEKKPEAVVVKPKLPERPRTPLEKLDLGQLKLTAIVTAQDQKRALVEEASGKGYVVELGTRIGLERGAVVEIAQDRIVIEHSAEDDFGKATSRKRELKLQKPPGD